MRRGSGSAGIGAVDTAEGATVAVEGGCEGFVDAAEAN